VRSARRGQLRNCSIVVVKLDRLSEACFHQLTDEKVRFFVAELRPDVDPFAMHIYAALAEKERRNIPIRIQQALAAAKVGGFHANATRRRKTGAEQIHTRGCCGPS
jgi:DNA invertase Pin-like site-specific DNA recombinase